MNTDTNPGSLKGKEFIGRVVGASQNWWEAWTQAQGVDADQYLTGAEDGGRFPVKGQEEIFSGDGNILYLDCDAGYMEYIPLSELTKLYTLFS